jgi:hypothetical protein
MKFLFLVLIPFFTISQKIPSDVKHFYGSFVVCESVYKIQELVIKDQRPVNRFLLTIAAGITAGVSKELHDQYRCNKAKRTGFDKMDLATDGWAILCWVPFRICVNDWNKRKIKPIDFQDY